MATSFVVTQLLLRSAPGYVPQVRRAMSIQINDIDSVRGMLSDSTLGGTQINAMTMSKFAPNVANFATHGDSNILIPGDWGGERFVFYLSLDITTATRTHQMLVSGYTDKIAMNARELDPLTRFYPVSILEYNTINHQHQIMKSSNVLVPSYYDQGLSGGPSNYTLRPNDLALNMFADQAMESAVPPAEEYGYPSFGQNEQQINFVQNQTGLHSQTNMSQTANVSPIQWTQRAMKASVQSRDQSGYDSTGGGDVVSRYSDMASRLHEDEILTNVFLGHNPDIQTSMAHNGGSFDLGTLNRAVAASGQYSLLRLDSPLIEVIRSTSSGIVLESNNWNATTNEAIGATAVRSIMQGMMQDAFMLKVAFVFDNMYPIGIDNPDYGNGNLGIYNVLVDPSIPPIAFNRGTDANYIHAQITKMRTRIADEICPLLSKGGQAAFSVRVVVDVSREISIEIYYADSQLTTAELFTSPAFGSSLLNPMVCSQEHWLDTSDNFFNLNSSMDMIRHKTSTHTNKTSLF